jgi:hypothetical protein
MNAAVAQVDEESEVRRMHDLLSAQREACQLTPFPSANSRIDDMKRLKASLHKHNDALTTALDIDFSCRCRDVTTIGELIPIMAAINYS